MANTPNVEIPYVPEGTLDPAAGLNDALNVIDALLQPRVIAMDLTEPPATGDDGDMYIVAPSGASGAWAGKENWLARYVLEGQFWQFYEPGVQVQTVVNNDDGLFYVYDASSSPDAWVQVQGGGGSLTTPIVTLNGTAYSLGDLTNGAWHSFTNAGSVVVTIEDEASEPIEDEAEFGIYCAGAGGLTVDVVSGVDVVPPKGGTLTLEQGDFVLIKRLGEDSFKILGESVSESSP